MPRRARLAIAGIPWHIIQRGNNRTACFYTDDDYRYYLATKSKGSVSIEKRLGFIPKRLNVSVKFCFPITHPNSKVFPFLFLYSQN